jgi:hypothetical protein
MLGLICGLQPICRRVGWGWYFRAKAHFSDDEAVAKMGHPVFVVGQTWATRPTLATMRLSRRWGTRSMGGLYVWGTSLEFLLVMNGASRMCVSFHV